MTRAAQNDALAPSSRPATEGEDSSSNYVIAFGRGLAVIRCFTAERPALTIAEVARAADLNRATARRFLHTLEADGYLRVEDGGRYVLRPAIMELGHAYLSSMGIDDQFQEHLQDLAEHVHESCSAGALEGNDVVFVGRAQTTFPRVMTLSLEVGARLPAHASAIGRVLLSQLSNDDLEGYLDSAQFVRHTDHTITDPVQLRDEVLRVRRDGWSLIAEEMEAGVCALAVPVHLPGRPALAISVASHTTRTSPEVMLSHYLGPLQQTAVALENEA